MKKSIILRQFKWKIFLLRILVHAIALGLTVLIIPEIYFINFSILSLLLVTLVLGVLNALVRPILQLLTFRLLFVSYGLVIVLINALILYLLTLLVPNRFSVDSLLWALVGGFLVGILGNFLENLFGITLPILPDTAKELRKQIEAQDVSLLEAWLKERKAARNQSQTVGRTKPLPESGIVSETVEEAEAIEASAGEAFSGQAEEVGAVDAPASEDLNGRAYEVEAGDKSASVTLPEPENTSQLIVPAQTEEAEAVETPENEPTRVAGGEG